MQAISIRTRRKEGGQCDPHSAEEETFANPRMISLALCAEKITGETISTGSMNEIEKGEGAADDTNHTKNKHTKPETTTRHRGVGDQGITL